jgi:hypothetical protein
MHQTYNSFQEVNEVQRAMNLLEVALRFFCLFVSLVIVFGQIDVPQRFVLTTQT